MELKKYKETLREDPDPYDDNEVKQDMHMLEGTPATLVSEPQEPT